MRNRKKIVAGVLMCVLCFVSVMMEKPKKVSALEEPDFSSTMKVKKTVSYDTDGKKPSSGCNSILQNVKSGPGNYYHVAIGYSYKSGTTYKLAVKKTYMYTAIGAHIFDLTAAAKKVDKKIYARAVVDSGSAALPIYNDGSYLNVSYRQWWR